jgi:hypothetical protein
MLLPPRPDAWNSFEHTAQIIGAMPSQNPPIPFPLSAAGETQTFRHLVIGVNIVGKAVQQNDGRSRGPSGARAWVSSNQTDASFAEASTSACKGSAVGVDPLKALLRLALDTKERFKQVATVGSSLNQSFV